MDTLRVAIVGAGPAGFYSAEHLLKDAGVRVEVDMFDRLPTPFGLVRAGVAPDHPKIKSVTRVFERTAARPGFRFFGNVEVGADLTVAELAQRYEAIVYAYGTAADRRLGIPGEDLPGSHSATSFVAWYNAHPDFAGHRFDLSCERAVVVGNGNVAADVARMLVLPRSELQTTDTADHAIEALAASRIEEVVILGRRGPAQAAFTNPEVRELGELTEADVAVDPAELRLDPASREHLDSEEADPTHRRNVEILSDLSRRAQTGKPKRVVLRFCRSPVEIRGRGRVESLVIGRNELYAGPGGEVRARDTGEREELECGLVLRCVGYRGVSLDGVPFDAARGVIPNDAGRVVDPDSGEPLPGHYAAGWIKRGPSGVIGTNKKDALETVTSLLADVASGRMPRSGGEPVETLLRERGVDYVAYAGWQGIDRAETAAGEPRGRPRVKFCDVREMLGAADASVMPGS